MRKLTLVPYFADDSAVGPSRACVEWVGDVLRRKDFKCLIFFALGKSEVLWVIFQPSSTKLLGVIRWVESAGLLGDPSRFRVGVDVLDDASVLFGRGRSEERQREKQSGFHDGVLLKRTETKGYKVVSGQVGGRKRYIYIFCFFEAGTSGFSACSVLNWTWIQMGCNMGKNSGMTL